MATESMTYRKTCAVQIETRRHTALIFYQYRYKVQAPTKNEYN